MEEEKERRFDRGSSSMMWVPPPSSSSSTMLASCHPSHPWLPLSTSLLDNRRRRQETAMLARGGAMRGGGAGGRRHDCWWSVRFLCHSKQKQRWLRKKKQSAIACSQTINMMIAIWLWSTASQQRRWLIGRPPKGVEFCHTSNRLLVGRRRCRALSRQYFNSSVVGLSVSWLVGPQLGFLVFRRFPSKRIKKMNTQIENGHFVCESTYWGNKIPFLQN